MPNIALAFFVSAELCYYLLIAQTGIVEYFSSDIFTIIYLPIGGVIGSLLSSLIQISNSNKIKFFLSVQFIITLLYPNLSSLMLLILGIAVGAMAPLMINELKKGTNLDIGIALAIAYVAGTTLFNYNPALRGDIGLLLTLLSLVSFLFVPHVTYDSYKSTINFSITSMLLWTFLDSSLFETLSRDTGMSIWRDGYSLEIVFFHIIGIVLALKLKAKKSQQELLIMILFALSYLLYFLKEPLLLSIVYPIVISYYNVVILQTLIKKDIKTLSIYMIFIGWVSSGAGLFIALKGLIFFVPLIFVLFLTNTINQQQKSKKGVYYA